MVFHQKKFFNHCWLCFESLAHVCGQSPLRILKQFLSVKAKTVLNISRKFFMQFFMFLNTLCHSLKLLQIEFKFIFPYFPPFYPLTHTMKRSQAITRVYSSVTPLENKSVTVRTSIGSTHSVCFLDNFKFFFLQNFIY